MSNNNDFNPLQRNFNSRTINRLTISEQLDLVYSENNNLKSYLKEEELNKGELVKSFEAKICSLEYDKSVIMQESSNNYRLYENQINYLNNEILQLKNLVKKGSDDQDMLKEDYHKLEERYRVANEYIKVLPTPHESDRLNNNLSNLKRSNERYKSRLNESSIIIGKLENELSQKNAELANSNDRSVILKSQMEVLSEKLNNVKFSGHVKKECTEEWTSTPDLMEDMKLKLELYKNELVNTRQILEIERKKTQQMTVKYQRQIDDLQMQLDSESVTVATLKRDVDQKQFAYSDLEQKLKSAAHQKQDILGNMMDLQVEIDRLDNFGSDMLQQLFDKLFSEIVMCVKEVETVSQCLWKLSRKEELDISELLGTSSFDSMTISGPECRSLDKQFLDNQLTTIRQSRDRMTAIRDSMIQFYSNEMASDVKFCITQ